MLEISNETIAGKSKKRNISFRISTPSSNMKKRITVSQWFPEVVKLDCNCIWENFQENCTIPQKFSNTKNTLFQFFKNAIKIGSIFRILSPTSESKSILNKSYSSITFFNTEGQFSGMGSRLPSITFKSASPVRVSWPVAKSYLEKILARGLSSWQFPKV